MSAGLAVDIRVFRDSESMSHAAADHFLGALQRAGASEGLHSVALSGGSTPRKLYALLATPPYRDRIDWARLHVFWADERCVAPDDEQSNYRLVRSQLLDHVPLPEENIHRIRGEEGPERAALVYEEELHSFFGQSAIPSFDLIVLGAGEDGHTASLFPGSSSVQERTRLVAPVPLSSPKLSRVTLTLPVLNHAHRVLFLASGVPKAVVVHEIAEDGNPRQYPAGLVQPASGTVTWLVDKEAAELLTEPPSPG